MRHTGVHLDLVLQSIFLHRRFAVNPNLIGEEWVILHADQTQRRLQSDKVHVRHRRRMRQHACLDQGALSGGTSLRIRWRRVVLHLIILRQQQHITPAEAVSGGIDALLDGGIGELYLAAVNHAVQQRHDFLLSVLGQPHVDQEALGGFGSAQLEHVEKRGGRGVDLVFETGRVGRGLAAKEIGHDHQVALGGELVGLDLVVGGQKTRATGQQQQKPGRCVRIVGRFGDIALSHGQQDAEKQNVRDGVVLSFSSF